MLLIYFLIGIFAAIVGALPLGASNIAVINTTLKQNAKQAFKIAITAGIAEVLLSFYALECSAKVKSYFDHNIWIQVTIIVLLLIIGAFLFLKKQSKKPPRQRKLAQSKYITGFFLGILNPPVLIYWIVAIGLINHNNYALSFQSSLSVLFVFFFGIYLGKILTLYLYSRFSLLLKNRVQNLSLIVNKITGMLLIVIGLVQAIKLYAF